MVSTRGVRYKFSEGERVLCYEPDPTKAKVLYDSKVLEVIENKDKRGRRTVEYLIHFQGWNSSWDRCVGEDFVLKDTEENRQLQRDLAEKSQLQLGAYLYRRERKKGGASGSAGSSAAKRSRHRFSDDGSSSSTQPDEPENEGAGDGAPEPDAESSQESHKQEIKQEIKEEIESDSSESSENEPRAHAASPCNHAPAPVGRAHLTLPAVLRDRLTFDFHLIVKRNCLTRLPATPCAAQILESFVKWFARAGAWQTPRCRNEPPQKPDLADVSRRLNLVREVADGMRVYFDFILRSNLLYKPELAQYHYVCGQFIDQQEHKMKEELESDGLSQDEYDEDIGSAEEDMKSPKIPEYSHLPPDPVQGKKSSNAPDILNGGMINIILIKQEIKEEPEDIEEEGEMTEEIDSELQEEMQEAMQQEMQEGMEQEMQEEMEPEDLEDDEMQQHIKEEVEDQDDYQEESQDEYQEEYQEDLLEVIQEQEESPDMQEVLHEEIHLELLQVIKHEIEDEIHVVIREELEEMSDEDETVPDEEVEPDQDEKEDVKVEMKDDTIVKEEEPVKIKEEKDDVNDEDSENLQSTEMESEPVPEQVPELKSDKDVQSQSKVLEETHSGAIASAPVTADHGPSEGHHGREGLRSQTSESHHTREGLRSQASESHHSREGLRSQSMEGHHIREGLRSQSMEGHHSPRSPVVEETFANTVRRELRRPNTRSRRGNNSPDIGNNSPAVGNNSPAVGNNSPAVGNNSPAVGNNSPAVGNNSPAVGNNSPAVGNNSPAFERGTNSPGVQRSIISSNIQKGNNSPSVQRGNNSPRGSNSPCIQKSTNSPSVQRGNNSPAVEDFPDRVEDPDSFANTIRNQLNRPTTRGQRRRCNNSPATPPVHEEPHSSNASTVEAPLITEIKQEPGVETNRPATRTRTRSDNRKSINSPAVNLPAVNSPAVNLPAVNLPADNSPTANSPAVSSPAANSPGVSSPAVDSPATNLPVTITPAVNSPAANSPAISSPAVNPSEETPECPNAVEKVHTLITEIKQEPRDPETSRPATRSGNVARRLRSHKSTVSQSENDEPQPSTSRAEPRNFEHSSSVYSGSGSSNEEWSKPAEPAAAPSASTRTPLSLLLDKVSKYEIIPREGTEHLPCRVYGAIHLARLFVRLPDFLNATQMSDLKLKLIVKHIDMFIQYLVEHKEWFGDKFYYCDSMSRST